MIDKSLNLNNNKKVVFGIFEETDNLLSATKKVYDKGLQIIDCYTPYPVHGLEKAMGLNRSRLPILAFCCAMLGLVTAVLLQSFIMVFDWPIIIGNKPFAGLPAWIPVTFELSILMTAFGIGIFFFFRSGMIHGKVSKDIVDLRQTDDRLIIAIAIDNDGINESELSAFLYKEGAVDVKRRVYENEDEYADESFDNSSGKSVTA